MPITRVIGVHPVTAAESVHLIEVEFEGGHASFDFGQVTQEVVSQPQSRWQVAFDERESGKGRFVFFFHHLDTTKPLLTSAGPFPLPPESPVPEHLQAIEYERP